MENWNEVFRKIHNGYFPHISDQGYQEISANTGISIDKLKYAFQNHFYIKSSIDNCGDFGIMLNYSYQMEVRNPNNIHYSYNVLIPFELVEFVKEECIND